jgi:secretion/DNA translocation related TadE-like protein
VTGRDETGSGTVLALAGVVVLVLTALALLAVAAAVSARTRAAAAADEAALAAAWWVGAGDRAACANAARVARLDGAVLATCHLAGAVADVAVDVPAPSWLRWAGSARLNARAGPAETYQEQTGRPGAAS